MLDINEARDSFHQKNITNESTWSDRVINGVHLEYTNTWKHRQDQQQILSLCTSSSDFTPATATSSSTPVDTVYGYNCKTGATPVLNLY